MTVLEQICADKKEHVRARASQMPLSKIKELVQEITTNSLFKRAILDSNSQNSVALITEIKKASPSAGVIRNDFDPIQIAQSYEKAGAACLSILTDVPYFQGDDRYIEQVKSVSALPILRKDFIIDPYQIYESKLLGADCVLLIMAALDDSNAKDMFTLAKEIGLDVLVEVHDDEELERAITINADMIGVNNRNLKTLEVDIKTSQRLAEEIPSDVVKIAESGLKSYNEIKTLNDAGYQSFLVGESLMRQENIEQAVTALLGKT